MKKERRRWTPERKLRLVLEALGGENQISAICRREGLAPNQVHEWRKKLLGSAEAVFARKARGDDENPRVEKLEAANQRMKDVIAEITAENLDLKKTLSG